MDNLTKRMNIEDESFQSMRSDFDRTLKKLVQNMIEKGSIEGKVTVNVDVNLEERYVPDSNSEDGMKRIVQPRISHKVCSVMQIKSEAKGDIDHSGMELVFDAESGEYVLRPVANVDQTSIFDDSYGENDECEVIYDESALPEPDNGYGYEEPNLD